MAYDTHNFPIPVIPDQARSATDPGSRETPRPALTWTPDQVRGDTLGAPISLEGPP